MCVCGRDLVGIVTEQYRFVTYLFRDTKTDVILYVGVSENLHARMISHGYAGVLKQCNKDRRHVYVCLSMILPELDVYRLFKPFYNKVMPSSDVSSIVRLPQNCTLAECVPVSSNINVYLEPHNATTVASTCYIPAVGLLFGCTHLPLTTYNLENVYRNACYLTRASKCFCKVPCILSRLWQSFRHEVSAELFARTAFNGRYLVSLNVTRHYDLFEDCPRLKCATCTKLGAMCEKCSHTVAVHKMIEASGK